MPAEGQRSKPSSTLDLTNDAVVRIDNLIELPDYQGNGLYPLDLFFGADQFTLQILHLVLDILLL